ncbi:hypothetical protein HMF7854_04330 [Sphingomonas ginkgonis]|uniref:Uncharacterized protein n=1 Tax=Sphingomonas ginkgonis TaxID=2315330 RepID=A0A3R9WMU2_9SPHN|nr:hypothetical protein [Sphingomonas ginkgonis]RST30137.1 hypothetical protein HMF7854_04330 [Sphingomonas ginkgonis]
MNADDRLATEIAIAAANEAMRSISIKVAVLPARLQNAAILAVFVRLAGRAEAYRRRYPELAPMFAKVGDIAEQDLALMQRASDAHEQVGTVAHG